mmetsp:Transcript_20545/g.18184  ORF Transcript_20545/g.18184 Transcript_20545/m.18184 type:complete len:310 (+) Transcript_20545:597-1526(+)
MKQNNKSIEKTIGEICAKNKNSRLKTKMTMKNKQLGIINLSIDNRQNTNNLDIEPLEDISSSHEKLRKPRIKGLAAHSTMRTFSRDIPRVKKRKLILRRKVLQSSERRKRSFDPKTQGNSRRQAHNKSEIVSPKQGLENQTFDISQAKDTEMFEKLQEAFAEANTLHFDTMNLNLDHDKNCHNHDKSSKYFVKLGPYSLKYALPTRLYMKIRRNSKSRSGQNFVVNKNKTPIRLAKFDKESMLLKKIKLNKHINPLSQKTSKKKLDSLQLDLDVINKSKFKKKFDFLTSQLSNLYSNKSSKKLKEEIEE